MASVVVNLQEIFNLTDKSGKGVVDTLLIGTLLRFTGLNPTEQDCAQIIKSVGEAQISFEDFARIYGEQRDKELEFKATTTKGSSTDPRGNNSIIAMTNAIKTFDHQGTGYISVNELKFILTGLGDKLKDEEFADLKQFMEISPNGLISYEQFISSIHEA